MYLCIKKVHLFNTQLIQGDGVERMFHDGSSGRQKSLIWGASDQTDSKWTAKLSASWRWTCSSTESPKAVISCIRTSREDSETLWPCSLSPYVLTTVWRQKWDQLALVSTAWTGLHAWGWKIEALKDWYYGDESLLESFAKEAVKMEKLHTRQFLLLHKFGIRLPVHHKFGTFGYMWRML